MHWSSFSGSVRVKSNWTEVEGKLFDSWEKETLGWRERMKGGGWEGQGSVTFVIEYHQLGLSAIILHDIRMRCTGRERGSHIQLRQITNYNLFWNIVFLFVCLFWLLHYIWPQCCAAKRFHMLLFWGCHSPSLKNHRPAILSLWLIQRFLIICCQALWKRHQPLNWTCVVQTQIKHLGLSISPWVLSVY